MLTVGATDLGSRTKRETTDQCEFSQNEKVGDLIQCPDDMVLVHCVSQDYQMGAGIAKEFQIRFPKLGGL